MGEFKGTPGPWFYYHNGCYPEIKIGDGTYDQCVGSLQENHYIPIDRNTSIANAHLVAAAPELLEALQDACECLEILASKLCCQTQSASLKSDAEDFGSLEILARSRDIINKALGTPINETDPITQSNIEREANNDN